MVSVWEQHLGRPDFSHYWVAHNYPYPVLETLSEAYFSFTTGLDINLYYSYSTENLWLPAGQMNECFTTNLLPPEQSGLGRTWALMMLCFTGPESVVGRNSPPQDTRQVWHPEIAQFTFPSYLFVDHSKREDKLSSEFHNINFNYETVFESACVWQSCPSPESCHDSLHTDSLVPFPPAVIVSGHGNSCIAQAKLSCQHHLQHKTQLR